MKLLIDGDVVRYRCGFAAQKTRYTVHCPDKNGEPLDMGMQFENAKDANAYMKEHDPEGVDLVRQSFQEIEPVENALHSVKLMMQKMQDKWPEAEMTTYFSCRTPDNWRTQLYPQYKSNRPARRPEHDEAISEYMRKKYQCGFGDGLEADDLIAMAAKHCRSTDEEYVVCSIDKDLKQIGGPFYDFVKDEYVDVDWPAANFMLEAQKITGDSVDNIPGIAGWGVKKAEKWLTDPTKTAWDAYESVFENREVAWYHYCLNQALVTLPGNDFELKFLTQEVLDARKEVEKVQAASEGASDGDECPRVGETTVPEVETTC